MNRDELKALLIDHGVTDASGALLDALVAERTAAIAAAASSAREVAIDRFVFDWFNERQPDELRRCLDAYDDARRAHMDADHASE